MVPPSRVVATLATTCPRGFLITSENRSDFWPSTAETLNVCPGWPFHVPLPLNETDVTTFWNPPIDRRCESLEKTTLLIDVASK